MHLFIRLQHGTLQSSLFLIGRITAHSVNLREMILFEFKYHIILHKTITFQCLKNNYQQ